MYDVGAGPLRYPGKEEIMPEGACKGCLWWVCFCILSSYDKPVTEGAAECEYREGHTIEATGRRK